MARFRVGPAGGSDDSWYFSNGFGATTYTLYNTSGGGYTATGAVVIPDDPDLPGPAGTQVFKWVRLTSLAGFNGGMGPAAWVVPDGGLTQSFTWSSREDGLFMDKFAFAPIGTCYTVAELTAGSAPAGACPPPPSPA